MHFACATIHYLGNFVRAMKIVCEAASKDWARTAIVSVTYCQSQPFALLSRSLANAKASRS